MTVDGPGGALVTMRRSTSSTPYASLRLIVLLAVESAMLAAVHQLGRVPALAVDLQHPWRWLQATPAEDAVAGVGRLLALGIIGWILFSTLVYLLALLSRVPAAIATTARVTAPSIRRAVERGLAAGLLTGVLANPLPAVAQAPPGDVAVLSERGGFLPPGLDPPTVAEESHPDPPTEVAAAEVTPPTIATVAPGDNLWVIAERALHRTGAPHARAADIAPYWRRVVEVNRDSLRSGDPDLIHPGETIELPPPSEA